MHARARTTDPDTSHAAAASIQNLTAAQARVLALFKTFGDLTDTELAAHYEKMVGIGSALVQSWPPMSPSGLRSRRAELCAQNRLEDTGKRARTPSGRSTICWGITRPAALW